MVNGLHITVPASTAGLAIALGAAATYLDDACVGANVQNRVALLLEEALMNVAMHGRGGVASPASDLQVDVSLCATPAGIALRLTDNGLPFDPRTAPPPRPEALLDLAVQGGFGVHLMRRLTNAIDYERADGQNILTLRFAR